MTYEQAVETINSLLVFGSQPGLERIRELVDRIGAPDKQLRFVHIAGTNGKGSTAGLIAASLTKAGYKTGLFISPFVLEFRERFMINGEMIPPQTLADIVEELFPMVQTMKDEGKIITEFEFVLAVALVWYAREHCDIVVLETGLGGRFDATNIIDPPLVSVITSISLDHTKILGDTFGKIAFEKCGIIKEGGITVTYGDQPAEAMEVIQTTASERKNCLMVADASEAAVLSSDITGTEFLYQPDGLKLRIRLPGEHQVRNAVTAYCALKALRKREWMIPDDAILAGFAGFSFPARMEVLSRKPLIILDGAHNPGGTQALADSICRYLGGKRKIGIAGMLADKDTETAMSFPAPLFDEMVTVSPDNPRKMEPEALAAIAGRYCPNVTPCHDLEKAFQLALSRTGEDDALVVFGSLYLASDMRRIIKTNVGQQEKTNNFIS